MFWRKDKQDKQKKINPVRNFMKLYSLSVNFMLFCDFNMKSENLCFYYILCPVADLLLLTLRR